MYSYVPCPRCHAETCYPQASVVKALAPAVEGATRTFWAPVADERSRAAARATGAEVIKSLATAGRHYQFGHARLQANDLISGPLPQGVLVHAEVQKKIDGPDGRYVILAPRKGAMPVVVGDGRWPARSTPTKAPRNGSMPVLVRADDLAAPGAKSTVTARKEPADGTWIFLAGTAIARLQGPGPEGVFILPLEWAPATMPIDPDPPPKNPARDVP